MRVTRCSTMASSSAAVVTTCEGSSVARPRASGTPAARTRRAVRGRGGERRGGGDDVRGELGRQVALVGHTREVDDAIEVLVGEDGAHGRPAGAARRGA